MKASSESGLWATVIVRVWVAAVLDIFACVERASPGIDVEELRILELAAHDLARPAPLAIVKEL
jgi:hypothetical protein